MLDEKLLKNNLHNGMHRETMLGFSYQVGFFLHNSQVLQSALAGRNRFPAFYNSSFNFKLTSVKRNCASLISFCDLAAQKLSLKCKACLRPAQFKVTLEGIFEFDFSRAVNI